MIKLSDFDNNSAECPQCQSKTFQTESLELVSQSFEDGEWGDPEPSQVFLLSVTCDCCGHELLNITDEIMTMTNNAVRTLKDIDWEE